jgi:hemolysin III
VVKSNPSRSRICSSIREPFSGLSHIIGIPLSIAATAVLIALSHGDRWKIAGFIIYGVTMLLLYLASSLYHSMQVGPEAVERLRRLDQSAIFLLIAGCYTPVCLIRLRDPWGWSLLAIAWGIATSGITMQWLWPRMPCWLNVVMYAIMGWLVVVAFHPIAHALGGRGLLWLFSGGIIYTLGAVVFATERPRLWPGVFGFHDLWHIFVLAGSSAHFIMMTTLLSAGSGS